jgi:hypothetical protein
MEADISRRPSVAQRVLALLAGWSRVARAMAAAVLGLAAVCGCGGSEPKRVVNVPDPAPSTSDAGARDAAQLFDAALPQNRHGEVPVWPQSEQTLDLDFHESARAVLTLTPDPSQLDVHFNVDTTASFGGEIDAIQKELTRSIIPRLRARVADTQLGVSRFADFPMAPFGRPATRGVADAPYRLLTPITDGLSKVTTAVNALDRPLGQGGDTPEAGAEALFQIATGAGLDLDGRSIIEPFAADGGSQRLGGVGFRPSAFRVVVHITDAPAHKPEDYEALGIHGTHSMQNAAQALKALGVRVIGIRSVSQNSDVRSELSELALATGAEGSRTQRSCPTGIAGAALPTFEGRCPWVFDVNDDGSGLAKSITDAVVGLLDEARFAEVHAEVGDDPLGLIEKIELMPISQRAGIATPATADRFPAAAPDGVADSYLDVNREHRLGFAVSVRDTRIAPSDFEQRFRVSVRLIGDGVLLEERVLGVRIPAVSQPAAADDDAGLGVPLPTAPP